MADHLCDECRAHFDAVRSGSRRARRQVRAESRGWCAGLDYYTRTTFEFVHDGLGAQSGMGGGGRYDGLMAELGGPALGGVGFGIGVDRTLLATRSEGLTVSDESRCEVYGVPLGSAASVPLAAISGTLRRAGFRVDQAYGGRGVKAGLRGAVSAGATVALLLGDREIDRGTVLVKELGERGAARGAGSPTRPPRWRDLLEPGELWVKN